MSRPLYLPKGMVTVTRRSRFWACMCILCRGFRSHTPATALHSVLTDPRRLKVVKPAGHNSRNVPQVMPDGGRRSAPCRRVGRHAANCSLAPIRQKGHSIACSAPQMGRSPRLRRVLLWSDRELAQARVPGYPLACILTTGLQRSTLCAIDRVRLVRHMTIVRGNDN